MGIHMKNLFLSNNIYDYCIFASNEFLSEQKKRGRRAATSAIKISVKRSVALKLLKWIWEPFDCWTSMKLQIESNNTARQMPLINKSFTIARHAIYLGSCRPNGESWSWHAWEGHDVLYAQKSS